MRQQALIALFLFSLHCSVSYCCQTCSSNKNQIDCLNNPVCAWANNACSVVASSCSSITNQTQCRYSAQNSLSCIWNSTNSSCLRIGACSSYSNSYDCSKARCEFNTTSNTCGNPVQVQTPSCSQQSSSSCDSSSTSTDVCYLSSTGACASLPVSTSCSSRSEILSCNALDSCLWNSTNSKCETINCQTYTKQVTQSNPSQTLSNTTLASYCRLYLTSNNNVQFCQLDLNNVCQPVNVNQLTQTNCQRYQTANVLTWSNECQMCADVSQQFASNQATRIIYFALVFVAILLA